jgi:hypothetical protein
MATAIFCASSLVGFEKQQRKRELEQDCQSEVQFPAFARERPDLPVVALYSPLVCKLGRGQARRRCAFWSLVQAAGGQAAMIILR